MNKKTNTVLTIKQTKQNEKNICKPISRTNINLSLNQHHGILLFADGMKLTFSPEVHLDKR